MKTMLLCLVVPAVFGFAQCAKAAQLEPQSVCNLVAEASYAVALEADDGAPDEAYESTLADCQDTTLTLGQALTLADSLGRYGVERTADGWLPTTAAEDAAADAGAQ